MSVSGTTPKFSIVRLEERIAPGAMGGFYGGCGDDHKGSGKGSHKGSKKGSHKSKGSHKGGNCPPAPCPPQPCPPMPCPPKPCGW